MTYYLTRREQLEWRLDFERFIVEGRPNVALTLGAGLTCKIENLHKAADFFFKKMHREAYGRNWYKRGSAEGVIAVGFVEHAQSNMHMHLAVRAPTPEARSALERGEETWKDLRRGAHYHYASLISAEDYARYITKDSWRPEVRETFYVFKRDDREGPTKRIR